MVNLISINSLTLPIVAGQNPSSSTTNKNVNPSGGDTFVSGNGQAPVPPTNTSTFIGAPTPSFIQARLENILRNLRVNGQSLRLHPSGNYFILQNANNNTNERYYPQFNGTFSVEGRTDNGDPVRPCTITGVRDDGTEITNQSLARPYLYTKLISAMGLILTYNPNSTPPNNRIVFNNNWTFTSPAHPDVTFHLQTDGSIWGSNGTTYSLNPNGTLRQQNSTEPLPVTRFFTQHGICPLRINHSDTSNLMHHGGFRRPGQLESFLLQADGSIFYTGRKLPDGSFTQPTTYEFNSSTNTWTANNSRREPLPSTIALARVGAYRGTDGKLYIHSNDSNPTPYTVVISRTGKIFSFRRIDGNLIVREYNNSTNAWTDISERVRTAHSTLLSQAQIRIQQLQRTITTCETNLRNPDSFVPEYRQLTIQYFTNILNEHRIFLATANQRLTRTQQVLQTDEAIAEYDNLESLLVRPPSRPTTNSQAP